MTDSGYGKGGAGDNFDQEAADARSHGDIGYVVRVLAQATLPHRRPADPWRFVRENGNVRVSLVGQSDPEDADEPYGLPYGSVPRLLLAWLSGEYKRTRDRDVYLGSSQRRFLKALGLDGSGGPKGGVQRVRWQLSRLIATAVQSTPTPEKRRHVEVVGGDLLAEGMVDNEIGQAFRGTLSIIDPFHDSILWWRPHPAGEAFRGRLLLSRDFAAALDGSAVPIDLRALRELARSPLAMDFYVWLTHRMSYLKERKTITWAALHAQFGADYGRQARQARAALEVRKRSEPDDDHREEERCVRKAESMALVNFRRHAEGALFAVVKVYPGVHFQVLDEGLRLAPSLPHVRRRPPKLKG